MDRAGPPPGEGGLPPSVAAAFVAAHISQVQSEIVSVVASAALYGVSLLLLGRYLSLFWHGQPDLGISKDSRGLRCYMVAVQMVAAGFFLMIIATTWDDATVAIRLGGLYPPLFGRYHVAEYWILNFVNALLEAFWTWRACRISASRLLRGLACLSWLASIGGFLATSVLGTEQYVGQEISVERIIISTMTSLWVTLVNALLCATILGYELVWKRRESLLKSTLVSQFAQVALRTSLIAVLIITIGAISITYNYARGNNNGVLVTNTCARIYQFASLNCILYSLLHRATIRLSTSGLGKAPNSLANFSNSPLDALSPALAEKATGDSDRTKGKRSATGVGHQSHHLFSRFRPENGIFPVSLTSSAERSLELDLEAGHRTLSLSPSTCPTVGKDFTRQRSEGVTVEIEVDVMDEAEQQEEEERTKGGGGMGRIV